MISGFLQKWAYAKVKQDPEHTMKHYTGMSQYQQYFYITYITSFPNILICMVTCFYASWQCDPPAEFRRDDVFAGNTFYRNEYCTDNPNIWEYVALSQFAGYILWDTFVGQILIGYKVTGLAYFLHHFLGGFGTLCVVVVGRFAVPLASANLIAEASTPFVCILYFLRIHKAPKDNFYTFIGVMMTISFFLCRNVFHIWLTYAKVLPALMRDDLVG